MDKPKVKIYIKVRCVYCLVLNVTTRGTSAGVHVIIKDLAVVYNRGGNVLQCNYKWITGICAI